jgi:formamidopyrimidine-DNA glycosylase
LPELPFLTLLVENLRPRVLGRTIEGVLVRSVSVLKTFDPPITALRGARIIDIRRRGKYLLFDLDPPLTMVMHLRRNGRLKIMPRPEGRKARGGRVQAGAWAGRDLALIVRLDGGTDLVMIEMGPKKSASVWLCRAGTEIAGPLAGLGVEPLSPQFTPEALAPMMRSERMRLKSFLLLQRYVVGIGNAYADEILWEARLSPQAMTSALTEEEIGALHGAIVSTFERAIEGHRRDLGDALPMAEPPVLLSVHRHGGEPCPRCGTPIAVIFYEDRETYYCPACQAGGKVYADRRRSRLLR